MQYRTYKETMLPQMVRLWKEGKQCVSGIRPNDSPEEWKAELLDKPDLTPRDAFWPLRIPAAWQGLQRQSARRNSCRTKPGQYAGLYIPSGGKKRNMKAEVWGAAFWKKRKHF